MKAEMGKITHRHVDLPYLNRCSTQQQAVDYTFAISEVSRGHWEWESSGAEL